jgi:antitoxin component YwqK of YwqJK toxin-antitoxin module
MKRILAPILLITLLFPSLAYGQSLDDLIGKGNRLLCETTGAGCLETIDFHVLVKNDGVYHKQFNQIPFTGNVTGVYQGYLKNGKKHGPWSDFWDGGRIANTRTYKDGILVSHTIYRKNGTVEVRRNYKLGSSELELDGSFEEYWKNGQVAQKGIFKNGKEHGSWISYHKNGQLKSKGVFINGKRDGSWVTHHQNGQVESQGNYLAVIYPNGGRHGAWVYYHGNGRLKSKGTFKNGKKEGYWLTLNEDGSTRWELRGTFKNGVKVK